MEGGGTLWKEVDIKQNDGRISHIAPPSSSLNFYSFSFHITN